MRFAEKLRSVKSLIYIGKFRTGGIHGALAASASMVKMRTRNIFNGLLLSQLMRKFSH